MMLNVYHHLCCHDMDELLHNIVIAEVLHLPDSVAKMDFRTPHLVVIVKSLALFSKLS